MYLNHVLLIEQFENAYCNWANEPYRFPTNFIFKQNNQAGCFDFELTLFDTDFKKNDIAVFGSFYVNDPSETEIDIYVLKPCENDFHSLLYNLNWIPYEDLNKNKEIENLINHIKTVYIPKEIQSYKEQQTNHKLGELGE